MSEAPFSRGKILTHFEHTENNWAAVHEAMRHYYEEPLSLEDALMIACIELARQNAALVQAAQFGPPPLIIIKTHPPPVS